MFHHADYRLSIAIRSAAADEASRARQGLGTTKQSMPFDFAPCWIATSDIHPPRDDVWVLIRPEVDVIIDNMRPPEHNML